ncbi:MAG: hypothetical protein N3E40_06640, partial [Dehalococcoidia bacterium]|nr:hypothetical protein [Dehalococcoidia bacterium]
VNDLRQANILLTTRGYYRRKPQRIRDAEAAQIPIYVLRNNNVPQIRQCLASLYPSAKRAYGLEDALAEAEEAARRVRSGEPAVELSPQASYIRRLQHALAEKYGLVSRSTGKEPNRRVAFMSRQS